MFHHQLKQELTWSTAFGWFLMAFGAGCVNAGGFLATGRFVTHVTGFATLFGSDLATGRWEAAVGILSVPLFFLIGAFIAGVLIDRQVHLKRVPHFDWVMLISFACLILASLAGEMESLSNFGSELRLKQVYLLLALLCLASGLQNAALTSSSGSSVRVTHLTGLTTDLGLGLARVLTEKHGQTRLAAELRANRLRVGTIISFILGSGAGATLFRYYGYHGFLLPAAISLYAAWHGHSEKRVAHSLRGSP